MDDDDDFPFDLTEMFSPSRRKVEPVDFESDDDFEVPTVMSPHARSSSVAALAAAAAATPPALSVAVAKGAGAQNISSSGEGTAVGLNLGVGRLFCLNRILVLVGGLGKYLNIGHPCPVSLCDGELHIVTHLPQAHRAKAGTVGVWWEDNCNHTLLEIF